MGFPLYYVLRSVVTLASSIVFVAIFAVTLLVQRRVAPRLLRWYLRASGAGFVKFGQVLAMRFDLLPPEYFLELMKLFDQAQPIAFARVRRIIESDLGKPVEVLFAELDPKPLGSASVAQVHGARLHDGSAVVVKVMRPGVEWRFRTDLYNLAIFARLLEGVGLFGGRDVTGIIDEVRRLTAEELDFRREAFSAQLLHDKMAADEIDHRSPRVYFELSGRRTLTLERHEGVSVADIVGAVRRGDTKRLAAWAEQGIVPRRIARILLRSILEQCFHHRVFHADPHAGNLIALAGGSLGFIDFGMIGYLDEETAAIQLAVIERIAEGKVHAAYQTLLSTLEPLLARRLERFEAEVKEIFSTWITIARSPHATISEKSSGAFFLRVANAIRRAGLTLPAKMTRYYRAQIVCDMAIYGLDPGLNPIDEFEAFFRDRYANLRRDAIARSVQTVARAALIDAPRVAEDLAGWLRFRLPQLGRQYAQELSWLERGATLVLEYLQSGLLLVALGATGLWLWHRLGYRLPSWTGPRFLDRWWALAAAALVGKLGIRRVLQRVRAPD